jgi:hypothetical protein
MEVSLEIFSVSLFVGTGGVKCPDADCNSVMQRFRGIEVGWGRSTVTFGTATGLNT